MFTHKHYVPILKAKEGEFKALQETFAATKDLMTPLFEIVDVAWDYEEDTEAKTIDAHLNKVGKKILDGWGNERAFFVDSNLIDSNRKMVDGTTHHLIYLFNDFRSKSLKPIPTTGLSRIAQYKNAVQAIQAKDKRGVCLRLTSADLANPDLQLAIDTDLALYGLTAHEVDLVIDWEGINGTNPDVLILPMVTFINTLPYVMDWRTLTISASSFPPDLRDIDANTIDSIPRNEWLIWNKVIGARIKRKPSFGDYSIANPVIADLDPRLITISASIRYTCDDDWLIVRGRSTKVHGWDQYHNLCSNLLRQGIPPYCGATYSWGDKYISDCANPNPTVGTGNATTWRKVANNHHFQKVVVQISSLP